MEAEAANKRRRVEPDSEEPPVSLDFINLLHVEMLQIIISFLPIKSVYTTAVLSKRWKSLWRTVPLNLRVDDDLAERERKRVAAVNKILAAHPGPARRVSIGHFSLKHKLDTQLDCWFQSHALRGLKDLQFEGGTRTRSLPRSALHFAPTLRIISLFCCYLPDIDADDPLLFPQLKKLELYDVYISKASLLIRLLECCTALEGLQLEGIHRFSSLRIVLPTIRTIGVSGCWKKTSLMMLHAVVIEAAPCLERLVIAGPCSAKSIKVVDAPKLTLLGYTPNALSQLHIGDLALKGISPYSFIRALRTVKILDIISYGPSLDAVLGFLQCFPCTEKLYIELYVSRRKINRDWQYNSLSDMECLHHLTEISMHDYRGNTPDIKIAKFFIQNARLLKVMRLGVKKYHNDLWWVTQHKRLEINKRASMEADIQFGQINYLDYFSRFQGSERASVHDFSVADPFYSPLRDPL